MKKKTGYNILLIIFAAMSVFAQQTDQWLVLGENHLRHSNFQEALRNYNYHIDLYPDDPIGYISRGMLYDAMGRKTESELDMKVAERLNPLSLMLVYPELRSKYSAKRTYDFNFENVEAVFAKSPTRYRDYQSLFHELEVGHSQDSMITLVIDQINEQDLEMAQKYLFDIEINDQNRPIVYDLYGKIHLKRGEYDKAIEYFTLAIEANPSFSIAYHNRSICYQEMGQMSNAKNDLNKAIDLNDDMALFYFTNAKLNEKIGESKEAITNYQKAIDIDNNYKEALINYSQLLKGLGEYDEGLQYLQKALANSDSEAEKLFLYSNLYFIYAEYEQAISGYTDYLNLYGFDSSALFNRGLSKILIRKSEEGCQDLRESIQVEPDADHQRIYQLFCERMAFGG